MRRFMRRSPLASRGSSPPVPTPNTLVTARWRASLRIRSRMVASPTRSLSGLTCLRLLGGVDRPVASTIALRRSDRGRM